MGTKYTTELIGGVVATYADNSPTDDGAQTNANLLKYATITSDLTAPLHSAIQGIDGKLVSLVDEGPTAVTTDYTTTVSDYASLLEVTAGGKTITLLNPSGNAGYRTRIKSVNADVTVNVDGGYLVDTHTNLAMGPYDSAEFMVNAAGTGYHRLAAGPIPSGSVMLFVQATTPIGWTVNNTYNTYTCRIDSASGGTTAGSWDANAGVSVSTDTHTHTFTADVYSVTNISSTALQNHSHSGSVSISISGNTDSGGAHAHGTATTGITTGDINVTDGTGTSSVARQSHQHTIPSHTGHVHYFSDSGSDNFTTGNPNSYPTHTHTATVQPTGTTDGDAHIHTVSAIKTVDVLAATKD